MFNNKNCQQFQFLFLFFRISTIERNKCAKYTLCVLCITCIQELNGLDNKRFFLTNWEFDPQQFWQNLNIYIFLFFRLNLLQIYFLLNISHRYGVFYFYFSFVQTKNWDKKIIYKVIFSLGLTLPSYTHNIPNLSPQMFSKVFSQVGASKFSFFFLKGLKSHHSIKYSNFGYLF